MSYSSEVLADSPVGYWHLDETSGTSAADSSGNSRSGTYVNTPTLAATSLLGAGGGTAVSLLGSSSQRCTVATNTAFNIASTTATFTVECWVKITSPSSTALQVIADKTNLSTANQQWVIYWDNRNVGAGTVNNLRFRYNGGASGLLDWGGTTARDALAAGGHLVCVVDTSNVYIYWNGTQVATSARASGSIDVSTTQTLSFGATSSGGSYLTGTLDEVALYQSALSSTRVAAHYSAGTTAPTSETGVGNSAGVSASPVVVAGVGDSAGVSAAPVVASGVGSGGGVSALPIVSSGVGNGAGWGGGTEPPVQVSGVGNSAGIAASPVVASGVGNGAGAGAAPVVEAGIGNRAGWASGSGSALSETVDLGIGLELEATDVLIHGIETVDLGIRLGVHTYTPRAWGEDVRTGRPSPRLDITERDGTLVTTLPKSTLKPLTTGVNVRDSFGFTVDRTSERGRLVEPVKHYARLWRGDVLMSKGPVGPGRSDESRTAYECSDPRWFLTDERRVIGRIPKRQLLRNPGFTEGGDGLAFWSGGYDAGSNLAAGPDASVVADSYAASGKALQLGAADKVTTTKVAIETAAVFYGNRPYAWEPLMNGFLPGGTAAITAVANTMTGPSPTVHITGHTADADSGDGYALSLRRAQAARLVVLDRWPSATVTVEGKGETEPVMLGHTETAYRKNRRVELEFGSTTTTVGHSRYYYQRGTITQPVDEKVPLPLVFAADMRIITWEGAPKNGNAVLLRLTRGDTVLDEVTATMDELTPRVRWAHYSVTADVPADGVATTWEVRVYPPAGSSRWANVGLWPEEQIGLFDVDQALHVKTWVEHAQDEAMGHLDLGIGTRTPLTGVPRTIERRFSERMPVGTQLDWYTSLDDGLDLDYDPERNEIVTHYPRQGATTDVVLIHGGRRSNVVSYRPLSTSSQALASNVIMQADGSGASRPEGYARDDAALGGTGLEAVLSAEEGTPLSELDEGAASAMAASLRARPGWEVVLQADVVRSSNGSVAWGGTTEFLNRAGKGDSMRLVLPDEDVDGLHRLVLMTWEPETDELTLTLIEEA